MSKLLIYGATGATGHRLAELAVEAGVTPVVAGRRADEISRIADALGVEGRAASLPEIGGLLGDVSVVASCVGPYTHVGRPVLDAALAAGASYLDLTGECRFVERVIAECDATARAAGLTIVPSAGLGLTSGIAARAAVDALGAPPDRLVIGYQPRGMRPSTGTVQSTLEILAGGAPVASSGELRFVEPGRRVRRTPAGWGVLFPLTDVLTMHRVWPAAAIEGYFVTRAAPVAAPAMMLTHLVGRTAVGALRAVERRVRGNSNPGGGFRVAVAAHAGGRVRVGFVEMDDIYELTSRAALEVARSLLAGAEPGIQGPGTVVGDPAEVAERIGVRLTVD